MISVCTVSYVFYVTISVMNNTQQIEIEIKSLLGSKENAEKLEKHLFKRDSKTQLFKTSSQLNHYFLNGDFALLLKNIRQHLNQDEIIKIIQIVEEGKNHSTRTRKKNNEVILVLKATVDDTTSANGTARLEYETSFENLTLDQLDEMLLKSNFAYEAKWSRDRKEYKYKDYIVSIDRNAGYGYLTEFEKVVTKGTDIEKIKQEIRSELKEMGLDELPQDRLARMFDYYNKNWHHYYGTEKTFTIY